MKKMFLASALVLFTGISIAQARSPIAFQEAKETKNKVFQNAAFVESVENVRVLLKEAGKKVDWNNTVDIKIFTVMGGDPAMNGTHLNLAIFQSPADGYKVFELDDVSSFFMSTKSGIDNVIQFNINKDTLDANGDIVNQKWILLVDLTKAKDGKISILKRRDK